MRVRRNPELRQEVFIQAAKTLFQEKGYDGVSVRDVLAKVDDKSASPSVFYYYFKSKEDLYYSCIKATSESYVEGFRKILDRDYSSFEERIFAIIDHIISSLLNDNNIAMTGGSVMNRMFILDMKEKITREIATLWKIKFEEKTSSDSDYISSYLAGGVGEMIYSYMLSESKEKEDIILLSKSMLLFCCKTLGYGKDEIEGMLNAIEEHIRQYLD